MVATGAVLRAQRGASGARRTGRGQPRLRGPVRIHVYCVCDRKERRRDALHSATAISERPRNGVTGSCRTAKANHADPPREMAGGMSGITTHVLDTALGKPAAGIGVRLEKLDEDSGLLLAES